MHRERGPTGRVIIVIVADRGERETARAGREKRKREEKENHGREKERREERERREPPPTHHPPSLLTVCRLKTSLCVGSKRIRVYRQNARFCSTCGRFAGTRGCVLNPHTETFLTYTRGVFRVPSRATHTQHTHHTYYAHHAHHAGV